MPHRGFGWAVLGSPHKAILGTKEEGSFALKTPTDDPDAVKAGILGSDPLYNLLTEQDWAGPELELPVSVGDTDQVSWWMPETTDSSKVCVHI